METIGLVDSVMGTESFAEEIKNNQNNFATNS